MAGKKIWAYAKDKRTEEYVKGIEHKYKLFYIWEAQKMKESSPFEFQHLVFMSTQRLESERKVMHSLLSSLAAWRCGSLSSSYGLSVDP